MHMEDSIACMFPALSSFCWWSIGVRTQGTNPFYLRSNIFIQPCFFYRIFGVVEAVQLYTELRIFPAAPFCSGAVFSAG